MSSIFDPCGYLSPFTLRAKFLIQELWRQRVDWDDPIPRNLQQKWYNWLGEIEELRNFQLNRHHQELTSASHNREVHVFSDASEQGFGAVAYLRYITAGTVVCSILASKTHVAPVKTELSIPRLEVLKTFIYDFPKLHHSSPNSFGANVHLHKKKLKTVKVIERSRDVTPRSKIEKSKGRPRSPCAPNTVQFQPLFPELRHFEKNGTRHFV